MLKLLSTAEQDQWNPRTDPRNHDPAPKGTPLPVPWHLKPQGKARRALLRQEAARQLATLGLDRACIADIARGAGIAHTSIYHSYRCKRDLIHDVLHTHIDTLHECVGTADDRMTGAEPLNRLLAMVHALLDCVLDNHHEHMVLLASPPNLAEPERDTLRYRLGLLAFRIGTAIEAAVPALAQSRETLAPRVQSLLALAGAAPLWFRDDGRMSRRDYAQLMVWFVAGDGIGK